MNNIAQSNPEGELERLGGRSRPEVEFEQTLAENGQEEAAKTVSGQKPEKRSKKWLVIGLILAGVALIGVLSAILMLKPWEEGSESKVENNAADVAGKEEEPGKNEEKPEVKLEELDIDGELVQRLYEYFDSSFFSEMEKAHVTLGGIYPEDKILASELTTAQKVMVALQNLGFYANEADECKGDYSWFHWEGEPEENSETKMKLCFSGERIRAKIRKIFGDKAVDFGTIDLADGETIMVDGDGWIYDDENDEFVQRASGATFRPIYHVLLKAERDEERIYLYDVAGYIGCWLAGQEMCLASKLDGTEIADSEGITGENMWGFADLFDEYKWTFRENAEGDYVFEGLEKVR